MPLIKPHRVGIAPLLFLTGLVSESIQASIFLGIGSLNGSEGVSLSSDGSILAGHDQTIIDDRVVYTAPWRWTAAGGVELLPPPPAQGALRWSQALSGDGEIVYGYDGNLAKSWLWDSVNGLQSSPILVPRGSSFDGSIVVGFGRGGGSQGLFSLPQRWSASTGVVTLPVLTTAPADFESGIATGVSSDGRITVGRSTHADGYAPVLWNENGQILNLGTLAVPDPDDGSLPTPDGVALAISADASTVVGWSGVTLRDAAFRWTENDGMLGLGWFPASDMPPLLGSDSRAFDVSLTGDVIVGEAGNYAFVWTLDAGMQQVQSILEKVDGLDLSGWRLSTANSISDDGKTIAGTGVYQGVNRAWIATREEGWAEAVPEPSPSLFMGGSVIVLLLIRNRRGIDA